MFEWEDKVKAIKETQQHLHIERANDGEMETMKSEVQFHIMLLLCSLSESFYSQSGASFFFCCWS